MRGTIQQNIKLRGTEGKKGWEPLIQNKKYVYAFKQRVGGISTVKYREQISFPCFNFSFIYLVFYAFYERRVAFLWLIMNSELQVKCGFFRLML